jgi:hypothetical protein
VVSGPPALAEARGDEQGVVDAQRQAQHAHDRLEEGVHAQPRGQRPPGGKRQHPGGARQDQRKGGGDRRTEDPEQEQQHRHQQQPFGAGAVLARGLDQVVAQREGPGDGQLALRPQRRLQRLHGLSDGVHARAGARVGGDQDASALA